MALEMDAIKKIAHQLERLPTASAGRVVRFVQDWATDRSLADLKGVGKDGQLPIPGTVEAPNGKQKDLFE